MTDCPPTLALVHLGDSQPPYLRDCVHQIRLFNPTERLRVVLIVDPVHRDTPFLNVLQDTYGVEIRFTDTFQRTPAHEAFLAEYCGDKEFRNGYWQYVKQRFFYMEELMLDDELPNLITMEYDILLYVSIPPFLEALKRYTTRLAMVMDNATRGHPGFLFMPSVEAIHGFNEFIVEMIKTPYEDMQLLCQYADAHPDRVSFLPLITPERNAKIPVRRSRDGQHVVENPTFLSEGFSELGVLFDSLVVGQCLGGIDPRNMNGQVTLGYENEGALYSLREMEVGWTKINNLWVPVLDGCHLVTIHMHSKFLNCFLSDRTEPPQLSLPKPVGYAPKVVLVTGGCGFIGSNFINYFAKLYPDVKIINYDRVDYCANPANVEESIQASPNYTLIAGDLNDSSKLLATLKIHAVDTVIHFAAQTHVDNSFGNSIQFTKDNVLGTHTLLECSQMYGRIKRFVHISTDEVYGEVDMDHPGCSEKNLLNPTNPYAATKAGAEFLVRSYYYSFKLPVIITRGNNVYGPRQFPEKLIPKFITSLTKGEKCTVHGKGDTRRNFIHAYDVARAVDVILRKGEINNIYNIGTENEFSVMDIAKKLVGRLKPGAEMQDWIVFVEDRKFNDFRYAINSDALRALGWKEVVPFEHGLEECIQWYEQHGS